MNDGIYLKTRLPDGAPCVIIVRSATVLRLEGTCFRGRRKSLSGNFFVWNSCGEMLYDREVRSAIVNDVLKRVEDSADKIKNENFRLSFRHAKGVVGWSSTIPASDEILPFTEEFRLNGIAKARRVKLAYTDIKAPLTDSVTLVYELKFEVGTGWVAVVHTIYPGEDIGALCGNVTQEKGVIFFDFGHPGMTYAHT